MSKMISQGETYQPPSLVSKTSLASAVVLGLFGAGLWVIFPSPLLISSILVRLGAMLLALACYRHWRDARVLPLAAMFLLMACRQLLALLLRAGVLTADPTTKAIVEFPGYIVTALAFASIVYLWRLFNSRIQAEQQLQRELTMFQVPFEESPVGIWLTDTQGRLLYANPQWSRVTGVPLAGSEDSWTRTMTLQSESPGLGDWIRDVETSSHATVKYTFVHDDNSTHHALAHVVKQNSQDGRLKGYLGTLTDITELERTREENLELERQMQHAQKLESIGVLAGGVAHDFNNILMTVMGNVELLDDSLELDDECQSYLNDVKQATNRAAELSNQMLAYSGKSNLQMTSFDFRNLVFEMQKLLKASISKKISFRLDLQDVVPHITGDATQVRQVVMNLITNAAESIVDGAGDLSIEVGSSDFGVGFFQDCVVNEVETSAHEYVYLKVSDTGVGMNAQLIQKIFDPFFTTKVTGRGLGMSAVLGIVRSHKGAIHVHSEVGAGTTFTVIFPPTRGVVAESSKPEVTDHAHSLQHTVLVVDDEPGVARITARALEKHGFRVLVASDGFEAIDCYSNHPSTIDAVVLDANMPGLNGVETLTRLKAFDPDIFVILVSGFDEDNLPDAFAGVSVAEFLKKPYSTHALVQLLSKHFSASASPEPVHELTA